VRLKRFRSVQRHCDFPEQNKLNDYEVIYGYRSFI
jgi:hypothetical protein